MAKCNQLTSVPFKGLMSKVAALLRTGNV